MLPIKERKRVRYSIDNYIEAQNIDYNQLNQSGCYTEFANKKTHLITQKLRNKSYRVEAK